MRPGSRRPDDETTGDFQRGRRATRSGRHRRDHRRGGTPVIVAAAALTATLGVIGALGIGSMSTGERGENSPGNQDAAAPTLGAEEPSREDRRGQRRPQRSTPQPSEDRKPARVPEAGSGDLRVVPLGGGTASEVTDPTASYVVQVERDLPFDAARVGSRVDRVLTDQRGWLAAGDQLVRVEDPALADIRIILATPETTDQLCAPLDTAGRLSCRVGPNVAINGWRWANGAPAYGDDLGGYRTYVINHEVGHALGNPHVGCPAPQALAPVMVQQTIGLEGCRSNPWPARADLN